MRRDARAGRPAGRQLHVQSADFRPGARSAHGACGSRPQAPNEFRFGLIREPIIERLHNYPARRSAPVESRVEVDSSGAQVPHQRGAARRRSYTRASGADGCRMRRIGRFTCAASNPRRCNTLPPCSAAYFSENIENAVLYITSQHNTTRHEMTCSVRKMCLEASTNVRRC